MNVTGAGNAVRGHEAYARAATTERLAAAAAQSSRSSSQLGFKIGKFGVRYETEEPVAQDEILSNARSSLADTSGTVAPDLDLTGLKRQVSTSAQMEGASDSQWMRRYGANAYERSNAAYENMQAVPMLQTRV